MRNALAACIVICLAAGASAAAAAPNVVLADRAIP